MKLQDEFTTPEQSKRLLELGVPADSADCYLERVSGTLDGKYEYKCFVGENIAIRYNLFSYRNGYVLPCWSAGRLIRIWEICTGDNWLRITRGPIIDEIMSDHLLYVLDFSKLED